MIGTHHKERKNTFAVLDFYYNVKFGMLPFCVGSELYIIAVYCRNIYKHEFIAPIVYYILFVLFWGKCVIHVYQFIDSCIVILEIDSQDKQKK